MEDFVIDHLRVHCSVHVCAAENVGAGAITSALQDFNIDSCIFSVGLGTCSVIAHKVGALSFARSEERFVRALKAGGVRDFRLRGDLALVEIGGLFVGGSGGICRRVLDLLASGSVNIEYQLLNPSRYSFLINRRYVRKCIMLLSSGLSIRDRLIAFSE